MTYYNKMKLTYIFASIIILVILTIAITILGYVVGEGFLHTLRMFDESLAESIPFTSRLIGVVIIGISLIITLVNAYIIHVILVVLNKISTYIAKRGNR